MLGAALTPHNHNLLPNEVLGRIFILLALDYGPVKFPMKTNSDIPPQLVVSHVCSHWRRVALRTPELWSNTHLVFPKDTHLYHRWLFRARTFPVTLSIEFVKVYDTYMPDALQDILFPIKVKRLSLCLTYNNFMALSTLPEDALPGLSEFELDVTFGDRDANVKAHDPHDPYPTSLCNIFLLA